MTVKLLLIPAALVLCVWLTRRLGPWKALCWWVGGMALICAGIALAIRGQEAGRITPLNYLMGYILQWGYRLSNGQLSGIAAISWGIWVLLGAAAIVAAQLHVNVNAAGSLAAAAEWRGPGMVVFSLLAISWIVDGGALLFLLQTFMTSQDGTRLLASAAPVMGGLLLILLTSIALATLWRSPLAAYAALIVAGGPPLLVGIGYGVFVLIIVVSGGHARWN